MKTYISLLVGCSLGLAGAVFAQQPVEQQSPSKNKRAPERARAAEAQPRAKPARPQERPSANEAGAVKEPGAANERSAINESAAEKGRKTQADRERANASQTDASENSTSGKADEPVTSKNRSSRSREQSANTSTSGARQQTEQQKKAVNRSTAAKTSANSTTTATNASASATGQQTAQAKGRGAAKKPAPQEVQQVKSQNANFRAQPKPQQVPSVTFNQNHRIKGSDHWEGQEYQVFRSYHPEWHEAGWYKSHYSRVELIGGGYYFFNNGYWFPAWGYSPEAQYYAYDGPIYVGHSAEPPDQVIADTQALLQQMGYYTGQVDGLLGPLTRQALASYQADQGLTATASIDQPTLDSLGLA